MLSAVHSDRAKEQIACKVFIQCIKHTAAQSKLSVPLQLVEKLQPSLAFCVYMIKWFWVMKDAGTRKNGSWCHRDCRYREFGSQGPSVDPVVLFKMVLIQHLYGVPSLRRTADEISANICCRWFLGYTLQEETPHFSTVSYNFRHRFIAETVD